MPKYFLPQNWLQSLLRSVIRHKIRWFIATGCFFLLGPISDQLFNWLYIYCGSMYIQQLNTWSIISLWTFLLGPIIFFCYMAIVLRRWLLSEKWLMMIPGIALYIIMPTFGLQYPYCDNYFYNRPFMDYLSNLSAGYILYSVIFGPELIFIHFALRNKKRRIALSRRLIASAFVILMSAILFAAFIKTLPDC